jgi:Tfp pilus assembly protein PilX
MARIQHERRRESGSALFLAVMMLALMGFLGIAALDRVTRDEQVAGYQNRARTAMWAAEAGLARARQVVKTTDPIDNTTFPNFPATQGAPETVGDTALYDREGGALPEYYGDPWIGQPPIRPAWDSGRLAGGNVQEGSQNLNKYLFWANVVGQSPDGSQARLEGLISIPLQQGAGTGMGY